MQLCSIICFKREKFQLFSFFSKLSLTPILSLYYRYNILINLTIERLFMEKCSYCDSKKESDKDSLAYEDDNPDYVCTMKEGLVKHCKETIDELIVNKRFTKKELLELLKKEYDVYSDLEDVDESGLVEDYAWIVSITKDFGYIDIYYLKIPYGDKEIFVTEVSVADE
jgi:hypothetical protein